MKQQDSLPLRETKLANVSTYVLLYCFVITATSQSSSLRVSAVIAGFGGKKSLSKQNTADSAANMSSFRPQKRDGK
eukprot:scaffold61847_cov17-Tisochrysis_lutea.AAC.2